MSDSFSRQLLKQARHLATKDKKRPQQANLRRASSSAYYALFHFFIEQSVTHLLGQAARPKGLKTLLPRAYDHTAMRLCCENFTSNKLAPKITSHVSAITISSNSDLAIACKLFVEAQEKRHVADYDLSEFFTRNETLSLIKRAEAAIHRWSQHADSDETRLFLTCLLIWKSLKG